MKLKMGFVVSKVIILPFQEIRKERRKSFVSRWERPITSHSGATGATRISSSTEK
jgi:hypothetical protein